MTYAAHLVAVVAIYSIAAGALNLTAGLGSTLSLVQAGFYGVGAYSGAIIALRFGFSYPVALVGSFAAASVSALLFGVLAIRFRAEFLVLATIGMQVILFSLFQNLEGITGGSFGMGGIPRPSLGSWRAQSSAELTLFLCVAAGLAYLCFHRWAHSPFGLSLQAMRDDPIELESLGKSAEYYRLSAFMLSGAFAGLAGFLYASYVSFVDPASFELAESVFFLTIVIVGGAGAPLGPVLGAGILVLLPELIRMLPLPPGSGPHLRQIILGLALVVVLHFRPTGLVGRYGFD